MVKRRTSKSAAPAKGATRPLPALLIVDMVNLFDFEGGAALAQDAARIAPRIARLKARFAQAGAPVIYVNDNFMDWRADFKELVAICSHPRSAGAEIARLLAPGPDDYYILKPKHSAFLATPLSLLLAQLLGTDRVASVS